jgi:hypothetical protein
VHQTRGCTEETRHDTVAAASCSKERAGSGPSLSPMTSAHDVELLMRMRAAISSCAAGGSLLESTMSSSSLNNLAASVVAVHETDLAFSEPTHGGSAPGKASNIARGSCTWKADYLVVRPTYSAAGFRRRFRIPLPLYRKLEAELVSAYPQLRRKVDALARPGLEPYRRILVCLRRLATARSFDNLDDGSRMSEVSVRKSWLVLAPALLKLVNRTCKDE